jgi:mono/diheme cytochrome c family protein
MRTPALLKLIAVVAASYVLLKLPGWAQGLPVPASLVAVYLFFAVVTALLAITSTDRGVEELAGPVRTLLTDPALRGVRAVVFTVTPVIAGLATWGVMSPSAELPTELRSVHPAPPSEIRAWGRTFDLSSLENPFRHLERDDPERFASLAAEGGELYFRHCFFCHGALLDGAGHYSHALSPRPLPFKGQDTIAQLQESYVFWRIVKGGRGLPRESAPWASSMPAWEDVMGEDEVWKTILFIYDYTGVRPREWAEGGSR